MPKATKDELSIDPQTGRRNPKSESEADTILQAEQEGLVTNPRRPNLGAGEPNLDFVVDGGYADVKTPVDPMKRSLSIQARNIATKTNAYGNDVKVIVDLKNLNSSDKVQFKSDPAWRGTDMSKVDFVND